MKDITKKIYSNIALHNMLTRSLNSEHLCHAYLFYGNKGIGKKTIATYLATGILCKGEHKPCYHCSSCHKMMTDNHPDFYINDAKDAKNSIHIDTIRELRQDAYIKPNESDYKVYLIPNVENMSIGAFNALLKVLEEPPKSAVFLLTTVSKSAVSPTILSRCIPLAVYPLSQEECVQALSELMPEKSESERLAAAYRSNGILGKALDLLNGENYTLLKDKSDAIIDGIIQINEYRLLLTFSSLKTDKQLLIDIIDELVLILSQAVKQKLNTVQQTDEQLQELAYKLTVSQIDALLALLQQTIEYLHSNVNVGLLINRLVAKIMIVIS